MNTSFGTYLSLRYGMAIAAFALPWIVVGWGVLFGIGLQPSISDYYWAPPGVQIVDFNWTIFDQAAPSRVWFVGCIFAIAAFLYLYKGFSVAENVVLNLAAALAVGVAIFPMCKPGTACGSFSLHGFCAIAMFACLLYVVWFRAKDTLGYLPDNAKPSAKHYRQIYNWVGIAMAASPIAAFVLISILGTRTSLVFFVEALAITVFAAYWWIKSTELKQSRATRRALDRQIETPPSGNVPPPVAGGLTRAEEVADA
jgi:hypothetical protein